MEEMLFGTKESILVLHSCVLYSITLSEMWLGVGGGGNGVKSTNQRMRGATVNYMSF